MKVWGMIFAMLVNTVASANEGGVIRFSGAIVVGTSTHPTVIDTPFSQNNPARTVTETDTESFFKDSSIPNAQSWQSFLHSVWRIPQSSPLPGVVKMVTYE